MVNHEYTNEELMFRGFTGLDALTVEQVEIAMAAHGLSVVELERVGGTGQWRPVAPRHRRTTGGSPRSTRRSRFTGPAAGSTLLQDRRRPDRHARSLGTLNNCAGGVTPWGTVLSGEENFNQYFVDGDAAPEPSQAAAGPLRHRHDGALPERRRKWERVDERFDLAQDPNEANRFGWIVEVDPFDPDSTPAQAHRARPVQARGRQRHRLADDGRVGRLHGRRRALRLLLQVRLAQADDAGQLAAAPASTT